jgi:hypothetical protein
MPLYAQIICIGGNGLFAFFFALAGIMSFGKGDTGQSSPGLGVFLLLLAAAAIYSMWVLLKFRRYLGAEQALEREAHIAELREQLDAMNAATSETPPAAGQATDAS